jgi:hypothetical protein
MSDANQDTTGDDKEMLGSSTPTPPQSAEKDPSTWVTGDEPMTGAQRSYLDSLASQAGGDLNKAEASEQIERLQEKKETASPQSDDAS